MPAPIVEISGLFFSMTALTQKYTDNPPEGMTSKGIRNVSDDALLDMDYFLNVKDFLKSNGKSYPMQYSFHTLKSISCIDMITCNIARETKYIK